MFLKITKIIIYKLMVEFLKKINVDKLTRIEMDDVVFYKEIHDYKPYWDFIYALDELGLDYSDVSRDGFDKVIREKYLNEYFLLRIAYLKRNMFDTRFWIHKFKGFFKLFVGKFFSKPCKNLQSAIQLDKSDEIQTHYVQSIANIELWLEMIVELGRLTKNYINQSYLTQFKQKVILCDNLEDPITRKEIERARESNDNHLTPELKNPEKTNDALKEDERKLYFIKDSALYELIQSNELYEMSTKDEICVDNPNTQKKVCCSIGDCISF